MKCIMPLAGSSASGVSIVAATCNGSAGQYWQLTYVGQQRYKIMNKQSQLCINDPRSSTSSGTTMIQYACGTSANGLWTLSYDTVSDSWSIINGASGLSLNASYADGSPVIQYPFINALNMRWKFETGQLWEICIFNFVCLFFLKTKSYPVSHSHFCARFKEDDFEFQVYLLAHYAQLELSVTPLVTISWHCILDTWKLEPTEPKWL